MEDQTSESGAAAESGAAGERPGSPTIAAGRVAACLAFRNASRYLREWLLFHTAAGIDYFFLYNNDSDDAFRSVVAPWIAAGRAEVIEWPGLIQQSRIYDDCLVRSRGRFAWVAFIDDDEFLFDSSGGRLDRVLNQYEKCAGVAVSWFLYGTSGRIYLEPDYVIRRFTRRRYDIDQHHKCIVRPERMVRSTCGGHLFEPVAGEAIHDQAHQPVTGPVSQNPIHGRLRINHYLTKSVMELIERRSGRDIGTGDRPKKPLLEWLLHEKDWNMIEDVSAQCLLGRMEQLGEQFDPGV